VGEDGDQNGDGRHDRLHDDHIENGGYHTQPEPGVWGPSLGECWS
jgi:hypothetical protein